MTEPNFQFDVGAMTIQSAAKSVPTMKVGGDMWFRGNDCADVLGYKKPNNAVKAHVDEEWRVTLRQLLGKGPPALGVPPSCDENSLGSLWICQAGLIELCTSCKLPIGRKFKRWVFAEVLPTIFKTGSYSISKPEEHVTATPWQQGRVDGIELCKLKNASLHTLLTHLASDPSRARGLYATVGCAVNRAVLDTDMTKKEIFRTKQLPNYMSVPDFLDFDGHLSRQYVERAFQSFLENNMERLRGQDIEDTREELEKLGETMRSAVAATGCYVGLMDKMLNPEEARAYKRELEKARKRGLVKPGFTIPMLACKQPITKKRAKQTTLLVKRH